MDTLKTQMTSLVRGLAASTREREKFVGDMKSQTANLLRSFSHQRQAMAKTLRSELAADRRSRSVDVHALKVNADKMCEGFRQSHGRMRHSLRLSLLRSRKAVATSVTSLRGIFSKELSTVAKTRRHMARSQAAELSKDDRDRAQGTAKMLKHFHVTHRKMAHELAASLATYTQGIKTEVAGLRVYGAPVRKPAPVVKQPVVVSAPENVMRAPPAQEAPAAFKWPIPAQENLLEAAHVKEIQLKNVHVETTRPHDEKSGKSKKK
jgi:hypothetical protein